MSKFKKSGNKGMPAISTASLPDIVFMLLFFFMVTTVMRETTLFVSVVTPKATEIKKMEKKSLVSYIYIGSPVKRMQASYGTSARIQLNDAFAEVGDIQEFIATEREAKDERDDLINSKSYKVGYLLYEFSLFIFIGYVCSRMNFSFILKNLNNEELYENFTLTDAGVVFMILALLVIISVVKSLYQFYLYRSI